MECAEGQFVILNRVVVDEVMLDGRRGRYEGMSAAESWIEGAPAKAGGESMLGTYIFFGNISSLFIFIFKLIVIGVWLLYNVIFLPYSC